MVKNQGDSSYAENQVIASASARNCSGFLVDPSIRLRRLVFCCWYSLLILWIAIEKDLFDIGRPRTHVKVQFGQSAYWVEHDPTPHPYGETLTELLNYDAAPYEHTLSVLEQAMAEKDTQAASRAFMDSVRDLSSLPYFRLFLSDLRQFNEMPVEHFVVGEARTAFEAYIFSEGQRDAAYMREQADAVRFIQERYTWFLAEAFQRTAFEKRRARESFLWPSRSMKIVWTPLRAE